MQEIWVGVSLLIFWTVPKTQCLGLTQIEIDQIGVFV